MILFKYKEVNYVKNIESCINCNSGNFIGLVFTSIYNMLGSGSWYKFAVYNYIWYFNITNGIDDIYIKEEAKEIVKWVYIK